MNATYQQDLETTYGRRANFHKTERRLYSHDMSELPRLVLPLLGNTIPDGIIQPKSEQELVELARWASSRGIPLTPRAKASSGYGGVIPVKRGIVVDFFRMKDIIEINRDELWVKAQPGMVWEKLEKLLSEQGLSLRVYPSSYPSSTVGGWLAQGGCGYGSYEFGCFRDSVISARVVLADGSISEFSGPDLDYVYGACGITGLVSEVKLKVQPLEEIEPAAASFPDVSDLQAALEQIVSEALPVWSLSFINPKMAELKNKAPLRQEHGIAVEPGIRLPSSYIVILAYRKKDRVEMMQKLPAILEKYRGSMLSDEVARHEWGMRFKIMNIKRLGPSLVPAEVVFPLSSLARFASEAGSKISQPVVREGIIVKGPHGGPQVTILGFIPGDVRKFSFNFVFALSLTVLGIARKHGGRAYSTGMYFSSMAPEVLGADQVAKLRQFKARTDAKGIMNPGKVLSGGFLGTFISIAGRLEPLVRPLGNTVSTEIRERKQKAVRGIPADIAWYAYSCSQCGYCVNECDQYYGRGWESQSPRGKWFWLREFMEGRAEWDQFMTDSILECTTCELCNLRCSALLPIEPSWRKLRDLLVDRQKRMTIPAFEMMGLTSLSQGNIWAGYRKDRDAWMPREMKAKHGPAHSSRTAYFAGCTASYVENDIGLASVKLMDEAGIDFTYLGEKENCCGIPMFFAGKWDIFAEIVRRNITAMNEAGVETVITSCPSCYMSWKHIYPEWAARLDLKYPFTVKHYSEIVAEKIRDGEFEFPENNWAEQTVTWHDSCHMGRASGIYDAPRALIQAIPNVKLVEMASNHENAHCCGSVITLIKTPPIAADIGRMRIEQATDAGAEKILSLCPCCEFQFMVTTQKTGQPVETDDLARFACSALGYEFDRPDPEVERQWAVFEGIINLMTPKGFANLMCDMWPEIIDSMPFGIGRVMRLSGKVPAGLGFVKPVLPYAFPRLLPLMMPRLMPVMLEKIRARIPMPDYMAQQMPDLMPQVMQNLMPHMVDDVVPLVTEPMLAYLAGKS